MDCSVLNIYDRDGNVDEVYQALLKQYNDNQAEALKAYLAGFQKPNDVNYTFKSIDILSSNKAEQIFNKGKKSGWDLNKILTELQIPKEQKQIITNKGITDREEIITSLLAENSFVVEINTAKGAIRDVPNSQLDPFTGEPLSTEINKEVNTDFYSNLTVPGGTNYTENEIATPDIAPNIKGHAQFSTNNGIGWFRSDDKLGDKYSVKATRRDNGVEQNMTQNQSFETATEIAESFKDRFDNVRLVKYEKGDGFKTRRILEVQSDLFQKGRDKEDLVKPTIDNLSNIKFNKNIKTDAVEIIAEYNGNEIGNILLQKEDSVYYVRNVNSSIENRGIGTRLYKEAINYILDKNGTLQPDILSSPQSVSIYKKLENEGVLKISKLSEQLEDDRYEINIELTGKKANIKKVDKDQNQFLQLLNKKNNWVTFFVKSIIQDSAKKGYEKVLFPKGDTAAKIEGHQTLKEFKKQKEGRIKKIENDLSYFIEQYDNKVHGKKEDYVQDLKNKANREISQLKQEIADVESGQTQLSSIANFYEKTVTNILKKQGYNPVEITDEYGNKWNEVSIEPEYKTSSIQFATGDVFGSESTANELELKHKLKNKKGEYKRYSPRGKSWDNLIEKRKEVNSQLPDGFKTVLKKSEYNGAIKYTIKIEKSDGSKGDVQYMKKEGLEHLKHPLDLQIYSLKNERNKLWRDEVDTGVDHSSRIAELNEQIDELNTQKRDIGSNTKAQDVLNQWSKYSKRLSDIVNKSDITASEIWEGKKIYELWKAITDVDSTKNPVFEDGELAYKLVDGEPDNELVKELSAIRSQVELAGNQLQNIKMEVIRKGASDELGKPLSIEEVTKAIEDINTIAKGSLNLGKVNHPIIQAVWKSLNRVKNKATTNTQDKFEELDSKLEAAKQSTGMSFKEIFQLFREKFKNGDYTTDMVDRFTPEFKMKRDEVRGKMNELLYDLQKKDLGKNVKKQLEKQWDNLHKWRQDNLYTIDINALFPDIQVNDDMQIPDEYLNKPKVDVTPEQVKQRVLELVDGDEDFADKLINLQERKVREFRAKRYKKWVELNENSDIKEPALAFEKWLKINDPYKVDNIKFNGWNKPNFYHNIQINKNSDNINTQYDRIKNNKELKDLHQTYKDIIYEVGIITHESKYTGGWMSGNSLPFLTKSITDKLFEGGKLMGSDLFHQIKSIVAEVETGEEDYYTDPVTGEKIKKIQNKSVANKEETITRRLKRKVLVAEQEKGIGLTVEEIANLRSEVLNEMAGEQSIDIHKLMKLMVANGEATKQKQTIEDQVKLVQEYFNTEYKGAEIKRSGALSKTPADVGNIKDLLNFTLDNEFYGYNTKKTEGRYSKIRTAEEKKQVEALENKLKELNQKEPTTEDEKIELAKEKEAIRNEIKSIGMTATLSRSLDSLLKWVQLKAMAWQPLSAVANLNFGALTNIIEAADGRSFGFKELGIGYKAAVSGDKKLRNIMRRWNMLNNQANELYNRTTESTFLKNMQAVAPYKLIESTEWLNQAPILRAMMEKRKAITPDGKKVNMWEAYTEEGKLKEGYSLSEKGGDQADLEANVISAVKRMVELGHGDYYHKQYAKQFILGRLGMQFRTWMAEGFNNRFMVENPEELLGYTRKGRYLSYKKSHFIPVIGQIQLIKDGLQAIRNNYTANGDPANIEVDSANLRKNMIELAFAVAMFTAGLIMRHAMIDDDEEREGFSRYALNFFINQSTRLQTELWFYINPMEFERLNKNVLPVMRVLKDVGELFDAHMRFIDDRETSIQSGPFEGMNWAAKGWLEFIPPFTVPMRTYRQTYDILE